MAKMENDYHVLSHSLVCSRSIKEAQLVCLLVVIYVNY